MRTDKESEVTLLVPFKRHLQVAEYSSFQGHSD